MRNSLGRANLRRAHAGSTGGCVGRAEGGTLFLDDVADLGPIAQEILLRLARDRETRPASRPRRLTFE